MPNSLLFSLLFDFAEQSCSILNIVFMSEMQSEKSILQINAVQCVYVELCYKTFTSKYKKSNYNIYIYNVSDLPFDEICFSLEKWCWWHSDKRTNDRYVSQNNLQKKRCKCFDICTVFFADCFEKHIDRWFSWHCVINMIFQGRNTLHQKVSRMYWKYQYYDSIFCILM